MGVLLRQSNESVPRTEVMLCMAVNYSVLIGYAVSPEEAASQIYLSTLDFLIRAFKPLSKGKGLVKKAQCCQQKKSFPPT